MTTIKKQYAPAFSEPVGVITPWCLKEPISQMATRPTTHQLAKIRTTEAQISLANQARR
jgi:hypothetical protein